MVERKEVVVMEMELEIVYGDGGDGGDDNGGNSVAGYKDEDNDVEDYGNVDGERAEYR